MTDPKLINPDGRLLSEVEQRLAPARKTKPLWAKQADTAQDVVSLEGRERVAVGDYICRGIQGEFWPQRAGKLLERYTASDEVDAEGWRRFDPKPDSAPVQAAAVDHPFRVQVLWGELTGKPHDYVVRSTTDPTDIWIVDKVIFEASYGGPEGNTLTRIDCPMD